MRIETIHAALRLREGDSHVQYAPPSHLREASSCGWVGGGLHAGGALVQYTATAVPFTYGLMVLAVGGVGVQGGPWGLR
eukprot:13644431-Alexandrium_andersonii.AAC.1